MILGLISMGFLVPYVYAPKQGFGFFSFYSTEHVEAPAVDRALAPYLRRSWVGNAVQPASDLSPVQ